MKKLKLAIAVKSELHKPKWIFVHGFFPVVSLSPADVPRPFYANRRHMPRSGREAARRHLGMRPHADTDQTIRVCAGRKRGPPDASR